MKALLVKKNEVAIVDVDLDKRYDDDYMSNLLGIKKTLISSSVRSINSCFFRIYHQDYIARDIEWFSGIHKIENKISGDIPEEALFMAVDIDGENEEPLNAEILFDFVLADRVGKVKLDSGEETSAVLLD